MNIVHIAIRFTDRPSPRDLEIPVTHPYRHRWWLPLIGPTATCLLDHLGVHAADDNWQLIAADTLTVSIGVGKGTGTNSPLIRSLDRLTRFKFGHFDIEPGGDCDPCITLYRTIGTPSIRTIRRWPGGMQQAHAADLDGLLRTD